MVAKEVKVGAKAVVVAGAARMAAAGWAMLVASSGRGFWVVAPQGVLVGVTVMAEGPQEEEAGCTGAGALQVVKEEGREVQEETVGAAVVLVTVVGWVAG